ncbi:MAG TPA: retropepsin-like aspartic protease [Pyrinomonadaceae bacterium]
MNKLKFLSGLLIALLLSQINVFAQQQQKKVLASLPMKSRGLTPAVEVTVNGKGPFLFAVDTGAQGKARVDISLMKRLDMKAVGQRRAGDGSGQNARMLDVVKIDSLKIGELEFRDVEAVTRDYNSSPNLTKIDGVIGFNLLAEYLLTLDFPAKQIRIETGELPPATSGNNILNFENPNGVPVVELQIGSQKVKADIDSGNMVGGFMLPTAVVEKLNLAGQPVVVGRAGTVSSEIEIKQVRLKDSIRLGGFEFAEPTVSFPALSIANIGAPAMQDFLFTFDQKNKRLKLEKSKTAATKPIVKIENLKDYSGVYGERRISDEGGNLYLQRGTNGMRLLMVALPAAKDEFTLELVPDARLRFVRNAAGKITEIEILTPAGNWEKARRSDK